MTAQLDIQFSRAARDKGIKKAADHAGADWNDKAYRLFQWWLQSQTRSFTIEQFRAHVETILEAPPHLRAFGAIAVRAVKAGLIKRVGFTQVTNVKAHRTPVTLWEKV